MKTHLGFTVLLLLLLAGASSFNQGVVNFNNDVFPLALPPDNPTNGVPDRLVWAGPVGSTKLVGTFYKAELYYQDANGSFQPIPASLSSFRTPDTPYPGTWAGVSEVAL